jgi:gas vesicle protein
MNDNGKVVAAALAGLALGAIMGILFAPEKGAQIRNKWAGSLRRSPLSDPSEEMYHEDHHEQHEPVKNTRLKRPAVEKLKETKDKITAAAPHIANGISGH